MCSDPFTGQDCEVRRLSSRGCVKDINRKQQSQATPSSFSNTTAAAISESDDCCRNLVYAIRSATLSARCHGLMKCFICIIFVCIPTPVCCTQRILVTYLYRILSRSSPVLLLIYSASVAGEETLHTYSYVHSHIKVTR